MWFCSGVGLCFVGCGCDYGLDSYVLWGLIVVMIFVKVRCLVLDVGRLRYFVVVCVLVGIFCDLCLLWVCGSDFNLVLTRLFGTCLESCLFACLGCLLFVKGMVKWIVIGNNACIALI